MPALHVALTGGIASGKSAVADQFAELGAVIIDADLLAREVVEPGTPGAERIRQRFGDAVFAGDHLDRAALGEIVFQDAVARADLEGIIHPAVRTLAAQRVAEADPAAIVIQVIPLLVETGQASAFDRVVVVDIDGAVQLQRLQARNGLDPTSAE